MQAGGVAAQESRCSLYARRLPCGNVHRREDVMKGFKSKAEALAFCKGMLARYRNESQRNEINCDTTRNPLVARGSWVVWWLWS
jgi:hypothetical protein